MGPSLIPSHSPNADAVTWILDDLQRQVQNQVGLCVSSASPTRDGNTMGIYFLEYRFRKRIQGHCCFLSLRTDWRARK
jgi:hypothetical protein